MVVNPYPNLKQRFLATELVHAIRSACKLKISEPPPKLITARYHDKLVKKLLRFLDTKRKTLCEGNTLRARIWLLTYLLTRCYVTLRKHLYNYHRYPEFGSVLVDSAMIFERESLLGLIDFYVFSAFGGLFLGPRSRGHKFTLNFKSDP